MARTFTPTRDFTHHTQVTRKGTPRRSLHYKAGVEIEDASGPVVESAIAAGALVDPEAPAKDPAAKTTTAKVRG
jgi:hypothetical protein